MEKAESSRGCARGSRRPDRRLALALCSVACALGFWSGAPGRAHAEAGAGNDLCHVGLADMCRQSCEDWCFEEECPDGYQACVAACPPVAPGEYHWCEEDCYDDCDDSDCPLGSAACEEACRQLPSPDDVSECLDDCEWDCECEGGYTGCASKCDDIVEGPCPPLVAVHVFVWPSLARLGQTGGASAYGEFADGRAWVPLPQVTWTSSDPDVVAVDGGVVTALRTGTARIAATEPTTGIVSTPEDWNVVRVLGELRSIRLRPAKRVLVVGTPTIYHAFGTFAGGEEIELATDVDWSVADPTIATIDAIGRATAEAAGETTVIAVDRPTGLSSASSDPRQGALTVVAGLTALRVLPESTVLLPGETGALKARATFESSCEPLTYTSRVQWSSSDAGIASVDREGVVECHQSGFATISALDRPTGITSTATGGDSRIACGPTVVRIAVSPRRAIVPSGTAHSMRALYLLSDGSRFDGTRRVTWTASDPSVIAIASGGSTAGEATGLAAGQATITAFDAALGIGSDGAPPRNGALEVPAVVESLAITRVGEGGVATGSAGEVLRLGAVATFPGGKQRGVTKLADWTSSDASIVAVPSAGDCLGAGAFRLIAPGSATVSATFPASPASGGQSASATIAVGAPASP